MGIKWDEMTCPECGGEIAGTVELVYGIAGMIGNAEDGFEYDGHTEICWDSQMTVQEEGRDTLQCADGHEWTAIRAKDTAAVSPA